MTGLVLDRGIKRQASQLLTEMQKLLDNFQNSDLNGFISELKNQYPILNQHFRYKRKSGSHRYISALDIALLLAFGYNQGEVAKYLESDRQSVTYMAHKLRLFGFKVSPPQRPTINKTLITSNGVKPDRRFKLGAVIKLFKCGERKYRQVIKWLNKQDRYYDSKYHKRHLSVGVGAQAERYFDWLIVIKADGKITESKVKTRRSHKSHNRFIFNGLR